MAVKTITIDMEAYELLASRKREGESFSLVLKRILTAERHSADNLLRHLRDVALSDEALDSVESVVREREQDYPEEIETGD